MKKTLSMALVLTWFSGHALASTALVFAHRTVIGVASDGAAVVDTGAQRTARTTCKIRQYRSATLVATGTVVVTDAGFDVYALAKHALAADAPLWDVVPKLKTSIERQLPKVISIERQRDSQFGRILDGMPLLSVALASLEARRPIVEVLEFRVDRQGHLAPTARNTFIPTGKEIKYIGLGYTGTIRQLLSQTQFSGSLFVRDPAGFLANLVESEINLAKYERRANVGPPIEILTIDADGTRWASGYQGSCI